MYTLSNTIYKRHRVHCTNDSIEILRDFFISRVYTMRIQQKKNINCYCQCGKKSQVAADQNDCHYIGTIVGERRSVRIQDNSHEERKLVIPLVQKRKLVQFRLYMIFCTTTLYIRKGKYGCRMMSILCYTIMTFCIALNNYRTHDLIRR